MNTLSDIINIKETYSSLLKRFLERSDEKMLFEVSEFGKFLVSEKVGPDTLVNIHNGCLSEIILHLDPVSAGRKAIIASELLLSGIMSYAVSFHGMMDALEEEKHRLESAKDSLEDEVNKRKKAEEEVRELNAELEKRIKIRTGQLEETTLKMKDEIQTTSQLLMIAEATTGASNAESVIEKVVKCIVHIMQAEACVFCLWDKGGRHFNPVRIQGLSQEKTARLRMHLLNASDPIVATALEIKKPFVSGPEIYKELAFFQGYDSVISIPLVGKRGNLGLIYLLFKEKKDLLRKGRNVKIMEYIAGQVSIALEDATLFKESIDKSMELSSKIETIRAMNEIDRAILSTLDRDEILDTTARMVASVVPCDRATIFLADSEKGGFVYKAGFGLISISRGETIRFHDTDITEVLETGHPQYVSNMRDASQLLPFEELLLKEGFLSHMRVPLFVKGEVIGVLNVGSKRKSAFAPDNLAVVEKLAAQIGVALENSKLVGDLEDLFMGTIKALSSAIDAKSSWTSGHSERVTGYAVTIAKAMSFSVDEIKIIETAGLLHDIGKLGTYDHILDKPGKLTEEEFKLVMKHPEKGVEILRDIKQLRHILPIVRHHHERYDGGGYPDKLSGEDIPFGARVLHVADTFDAIMADRPYRPSLGIEYAVTELIKYSNKQFDERVVDVFLNVLDVPPGTVNNLRT